MCRIGKCSQWPHLYTTYEEKYDLKVKQAQDEIFMLKTCFPQNHFVFRRRKVQESKTIHQNVRNGHIYIQLMKQHMT